MMCSSIGGQFLVVRTKGADTPGGKDKMEKSAHKIQQMEMQSPAPEEEQSHTRVHASPSFKILKTQLNMIQSNLLPLILLERGE